MVVYNELNSLKIKNYFRVVLGEIKVWVDGLRVQKRLDNLPLTKLGKRL